jgi:hypothetical protein
MGRKANVASAEVKNVPVVETEVVVEQPEVKAEVKPVAVVKGERITFSVSFKTVSIEGDRINHKYSGVGATVADALEAVKGSDEDLVDEYEKPFLRGINFLVNSTARNGDYSFSRSLAPHVGQDIFENKNAELAKRLFGL